MLTYRHTHAHTHTHTHTHTLTYTHTQGNIITNGIFLAGLGLALSFVNIAWTTTYSSSANKLTKAVESGSEVGG